MAKEFKRKPHRKSIVRSDDSRHTHEHVESSRERHSSNLKRTKSDHSDKATLRGRVVGLAGSTWLVVHESVLNDTLGEYQNPLACTIGGLALTSNEDDSLVCVGDFVRYAPSVHSETEKDKGVIIEIEQRRTRLVRKTAGERQLIQSIASNIDQCIIVNSAAEPFYNRRLIDRYIIAAEQGKMSAAIVINKIELMVEDALREDLECYVRLGIPLIFCSCARMQGVEELRTLFANKTSMLAGPSGVGKSSIINMCFGLDLQKVREISAKYDKGKHTTTSSKVFGLSNGASIIDTPGIREFAITDLHIDDLSYYFHDFDDYYQDCKYLPCSHTHEPGCAVKQAVEQGHIDPMRYDSYLRIRETMI